MNKYIIKVKYDISYPGGLFAKISISIPTVSTTSDSICKEYIGFPDKLSLYLSTAINSLGVCYRSYIYTIREPSLDLNLLQNKVNEEVGKVKEIAHNIYIKNIESSSKVILPLATCEEVDPSIPPLL